MERFAQMWAPNDVTYLRPRELAVVTNITGQFNLWRQTLGAHGEPGFLRALTLYRDRTVRLVVPFPDGHTMVFAADQQGDEQFQLFRVDDRGGDPVPLTDDRKVRHELNRGGLDGRGRRLLYCNNARSPADMDVVLHDLTTGKVHRPLPEGFLWAGPRWDPSGERFSAHQVFANTQVRAFVHDLRKKTTAELLPHETEEVVFAVGWTGDGKRVIVVDDLGRDFKQLELVNWKTGDRRSIAAPRADVEFAQYSPQSGRLVYGLNEESCTTVFSGPLTGPFRPVRGLPLGHLVSTSEDLLALAPDGRSMVLAWSTGNRPVELQWVPLEGGSPSRISENMPGGVPDDPLPVPLRVRFPTFDGRKIPALYYRPKHPPHGKAPAVLSIHGGPETQERPGWMYYGLYAYLNSRGIYVLAPNIRGSTGYGRSYQKLIHHDWGGAELKDLKAAAEWLRSRPEIDPDRLGVFGGSFGGFATLSCVTRLPEYWKAGVDIVGPSNLITFSKTVPPFWFRFMKKWVGDPATEAGFLRERSPITYIDRVRADLLVIQGANDPRVNKAESDQMVERLRAIGRTVEYMVFPDEGHGFTRTENFLKALGATARFLETHLGATSPPAT